MSQFSFAKVGAKMDAALEKIAPKVVPFFKKIGKTLFPMKGDDTREIIRKIAFFVCAVVLIVTSTMLVNETVVEPSVYQSEVEDLKNIFLPERGEQGAQNGTDEAPSITDVPKEEVIRGLKELRALNPDTFGWITFKSTGKNIGLNIDYPVMQGKDNDYYLNRTFYKKNNKAGSLFLDYRNNFTAESRDKISIIYGHNLSTGLMFSKLNKLVDNLYNARQATHFTLTTDAGTETYVLFAVMLCNTKKEQGPTFNYMKYDITTESAFDRYVYEVRRRSMYDYNTEVTFEDDVLALSTCVPHRKNYGDGCRTVVLARRLRDGETLNVKLSTNADCLYPLTYYQQNELPIPAEYANIGKPTTTQTTGNSGVVILPTGGSTTIGTDGTTSSGDSTVPTNKTTTSGTGTDKTSTTTIGSGTTDPTAPSTPTTPSGSTPGTTPTAPTVSGNSTAGSSATASGNTTSHTAGSVTNSTAPTNSTASTDSTASTNSTAPSDSTTPSSGNDTSASEPSVTEPSKTEPSVTEPSETEPSETQPSETEPSVTEPSETEPSETQPSETEPSVTEPSETEPSETEPSETEPSDVSE